MKVAPLSFAKALANIVLPHPGCPYNSTPFGALNNPLPLPKSSGKVRGYITVSLKLAIISSRPPIPSNVTSIEEGGTISAAMACSYSSNSSDASCVSDRPVWARRFLLFSLAFLEEPDAGSSDDTTYRRV